MRPDRIVALCILAFSFAYGVLAWQYPLLPFEKHTPFRPNTVPLGLAAIAMVLSFATLIWPGSSSGLSDDARGWRSFHWHTAASIVLLMVVYAVTISPLGYIGSTSLFLVGAAVTMGERRFYTLAVVALLASFLTWFLVQGLLGVFLRPWPVF